MHDMAQRRWWGEKRTHALATDVRTRMCVRVWCTVFGVVCLVWCGESMSSKNHKFKEERRGKRREERGAWEAA
jgi:hypothetical protein